jgi:chromosome segregation ATPase
MSGDVLEANLDNYCRIIRDGVSSVTDGTIYEQNEERLEEYLDYIEDLVTEELENRDDLDDTVAAVEEWVEEANNELKQTRETIDSLREIINQDPRLDEFKNAVDDTVENLDPEAIDPPEGEADPPENPLYDSQRPYLDNLSSLTGGES